MHTPLVMALSAACFLAPSAALAQSACSKPPLAHAPDHVTTLQRDGYSAYRNNAVAADQSSELHLIGSYSGSGRVTIAPSEKPIVLVLSAYSPGLWHLQLQPGARLVRVILLGNEPQRVKGAADSVEILARTGCGQFAYQWEGSQNGVRYMLDGYRDFLAAAQQLSGLTESSFQGNYNLGASFTVPPDTAAYRVAERIERPTVPRDVVRFDRDETLAAYDGELTQAPAAFHPTMRILINLIKSGKLPVVFPISDNGSDRNAPKGVRRRFDRGRPTGHNACGHHVVGRPEGQTIECSWGNQIYVLGPGDDVLKDSWGDDIVNPGGGDDIIDLGWGNDIMVLESGWGNDVVHKTCHDSELSDADRARLSWQHRYNSFIVFGPGIHPADVRWESKTVLTHAPSKSRLTLQADCFNLVFTEDGELAPYVPRAPLQPAQPSRAEQEAARQQAREKIVQTLSAAPRGDVVLEVDAGTFESFDRQVSVEPRDGIARIVRRDGKLMLVFYTNGSRGIIEIRPKAP